MQGLYLPFVVVLSASLSLEAMKADVLAVVLIIMSRPSYFGLHYWIHHFKSTPLTGQ